MCLNIYMDWPNDPLHSPATKLFITTKQQDTYVDERLRTIFDQYESQIQPSQTYFQVYELAEL